MAAALGTFGLALGFGQCLSSKATEDIQPAGVEFIDDTEDAASPEMPALAEVGIITQ